MGGPPHFYVVTNTGKWDTTNKDLEPTNHTIEGVEITPSPAPAVLTGVTITKTNGAILVFWGATGIATTPVDGGVEAPVDSGVGGGGPEAGGGSAGGDGSAGGGGPLDASTGSASGAAGSATGAAGSTTGAAGSTNGVAGSTTGGAGRRGIGRHQTRLGRRVRAFRSNRGNGCWLGLPRGARLARARRAASEAKVRGDERAALGSVVLSQGPSASEEAGRLRRAGSAPPARSVRPPRRSLDRRPRDVSPFGFGPRGAGSSCGVRPAKAAVVRRDVECRHLGRSWLSGRRRLHRFNGRRWHDRLSRSGGPRGHCGICQRD